MLNCKECALYKYSRVGMTFSNFTTGFGDRNSPDIMVIFETPSSHDIQNESFFSDSKLQMLYKSILEKAGIKTIYYTSLLKCFDCSLNAITATHKKKCANLYLLKEIEEVKPKKILCIGATSARFFIHGFKNLSQTIGGAFSYNNIPLFTCFNFAIAVGKNQYSKEFSSIKQTLLTIKKCDSCKTKDIINTKKDLSLLSTLGETVALDIETTGLNFRKDKILTIGLYDGTTSLCFDISDINFSTEFFRLMAEGLHSKKLILHNAVYDLKFLKFAGCDIVDSLFLDTMSMQYLIDSNSTLSLEFLVEFHFGVNIKTSVDRSNMLDMDPIDRWQYCAYDAYYTFKLCNKLLQKCKELCLLKSLNVRTMCSKLAIDLEFNGITVDKKKAQELQIEYGNSKFDSLDKFIKRFKLPENFNPNSTKQLTTLFYDTLKFPVKYRTDPTPNNPKGNPKVDNDAFNEFLKTRKGVQFLLDYKEYKGLLEKTTGYIEAIQDDGKIHPNFNICSPGSLRMMMRDPNIQNCPKGVLQDIFIASPGYTFVYYDYKALEFRLWIGISNDTTAADFIKQGRDIHFYIASVLFKKSEQEVSEEERDMVKCVVYGSIYGNTPDGIVYNSPNIPLDLAQRAQRLLFNLCKNGRQWIYNMERQAMEKEYTNTPFGARRFFTGIKTFNKFKLKHAINEAKNFPIQSWGNEIGVVGAYKARELLKSNNIDARLVHQIHDAFIFEVKDEQLEAGLQLIKQGVVSPVPMCVPLAADFKTGKSWYSLTKLK